MSLEELKEKLQGQYDKYKKVEKTLVQGNEEYWEGAFDIMEDWLNELNNVNS